MFTAITSLTGIMFDFNIKWLKTAGFFVWKYDEPVTKTGKIRKRMDIF
ncbi:hypothetical protein [Bacillus xiapuensis]|nr:hypothetical protein [Bacillus xiapuensis]